MAIDFPANPTNGQTFTDPQGDTYVWNGYGWAMQGGAAPVDAYTKTESDAKFVKLTGDNMTGNLSIRSPTRSAYGLYSADGSASSIQSYNQVDTIRWAVNLHDGSAEGGANSGANFSIARFDDPGALLGTVLHISRATGGATFSGLVTAGGFAADGGGLAMLGALNGPTGNMIVGYKGLLPRWLMELGDAGTEAAGTNVGSDFTIRRYDDAGNPAAGLTAGTTFNIQRSNGWLKNNGVVEGMAFACKAGASANPSGQAFNLDWANVPNLYIWDVFCGTLAFVSDYRVKKDVEPLPAMWDTVKALNPIKYTHAEYTPEVEQTRAAESGTPFIAADDIERWGFIAHELQETLTQSAATGVKDQADAIQSPNPFTLIAALTKALQEAMARIEALESAAPATASTTSKKRK